MGCSHSLYYVIYVHMVLYSADLDKDDVFWNEVLLLYNFEVLISAFRMIPLLDLLQ